MKNTLFLALLVSAPVFAQSEICLGKLCQGETVIDSANYVGVITSFKDGKVNYKRTGNNYENTAAPTALSEAIQSSRFPVGSYLIDPSNYTGKVYNAFEDGRVDYRREGNNYNSVTNNASPEVPELNGIKARGFVVDESNYVGAVIRVFENGKTQYRREGNNYDNVSPSASPEIDELNGIKKGVAVIDTSNYVGITRRVFKNQKVQYRREGNNYDNVGTNLVPEVPEFDGIKARTKVVDTSNYVGITLRAFGDGRVQYTRDGNNYSNIGRGLSPEVNSFNEIISGKNVMDSSNYSGVAVSVFRDGRVEYRRSGNNYNNISNSLTYEVPARNDGIKAGIIVVDDGNYVGTVKVTYADGRVLYRREGNNYDSAGKNFGYEVDHHDEYEKGIEYASSEHEVGKIKRFFSNGKIEFIQASYNTIRSKLYPEVTEYEGIVQGTELRVPMKTGKVSKVFANGTVKLTIGEKDFAFKVLFDLEELKKVNILGQWAQALHSELSAEESYHFFSQTAVRQEQYRTFMELLLKEVEEEAIGFTNSQRKTLLAYIKKEIAEN